MLADPWAGRSSIVSLSRSSSLLLLRPGQWQSHHQSAQSFVYSIDFYIVVLYHCPCCVARRVGSRRVLGGCVQNAPSPRHSTRKENRSLPLHNCILRIVTVIGLLGDHRFVSIERHPRRISESSIVTFQTTKPVLGFVRNEFWGASDQVES